MAHPVFENDLLWTAFQVFIWGLYALPVLALTGLAGLVLARERWRGGLQWLADAIDTGNSVLGETVRWAALAMVLVQFLVVVLRFVFGYGEIALQESILYLHGALFMAAGGYTLLKDGHVRVDIFYRDAPPRHQALVNAAGVYLFLLPSMALVFYAAWPEVGRSWITGESSAEASGLPVYPLKALILLFATALLLQGWSLVARSVLTLTQREGA